nr:MAG TPA: hypothetical protein [Caudoviricetes sp.]
MMKPLCLARMMNNRSPYPMRSIGNLHSINPSLGIDP